MKKRARIVALVLAALMLLSATGLAGCGGGVEDENVLVIGFLEDLTGPAGFAVRQSYEGAQDYFRMVDDEDLIPGLKIKLIQYDTRLDYSRTLPGYVWLDGQGMDMLWMLTGTFVALVRDRVEQDGMPVVASQAEPTTLGSDWIFHMFPGQKSEAEAVSDVILDRWDSDEEDRAPLIGVISQAGYTGGQFTEQTLMDLRDEDPEAFDLKSVFSPAGASSFAGEMADLRDCDYIVLGALYGPPLANFLKEARDREWQGTFIASMNNWQGFADLIASVMTPEELDGSIAVSTYAIWTDDIPWISDARVLLEKYRPDRVDFNLERTGWLSGLSYAMVMTEAIKAAVAGVGVDNLDGPALQQSLADINVEVEGWGTGPWTFTEDLSILQKSFQTYEYSSSDEEFSPVGGWYDLASLS